METVEGKKTRILSSSEFNQRRSGFDRVHIDIGCGDGGFTYRFAKENPEVFVIGLDPASENLVENSNKLLRKPSKGGLNNLLFVKAAVEKAPSELLGLASSISINFPWAALLRGILHGDRQILGSISQLARTGARIDCYLNYYVLETESEASRLGLPKLDPAFLSSELSPRLGQFGLKLLDQRFISEPSELPRSTWAGRLVRNSGRETLYISMIKQDHK